MPDVVGTGIIKIEIDESGTEADITALAAKVQRQLDTKMKSSGDSSGKSFSDAFSKQVNTKVSAALKSLPSAQINADSTQAEKQLASLRDQLVKLSDGNYIKLGLTDSEALKEIDKVRLELDQLTSSKDIRIKTNAAAASAELTALDAQLNKVKDDAEKAGGGKSGKDGGTGILLTSILALGPALVPLAAVAGAALGSIALSGGAALLAFKGISTEIKSGTTLGNLYSAGLKTLQKDLANLEATAAANFLGPFQASVNSLNKQFPQLNTLTAEFSSIVGKDLQLALHGIIGGFIQLEPLFLTLGEDSENLFAKFDKFSNGGGLAKFSQYVEAELPAVEHTIEQLGSAILALLQGLEPLGSTSLQALSILSQAINAIPVGVLKILVPLLVDAYLAFKAFQGLSAVTKSISEFTTAIKAAELGTLSSLGPIGAVVAGVGLLATTFFNFSSGPSKATENIDDFTDALVNSKLAIDSTIQSDILDKLGDNALKAAQGVGILGTTLISAITGGGQSLTDLQAQLKAIISEGTTAPSGSTPARYTQEAKDARTLLPLVTSLSAEFAVSDAEAARRVDIQTALATSNETLADRITDVNTVLNISTQLGTKYSAMLGYVADNSLSAATNASKYYDALKNATALENTANGATQSLLNALDTYSTSAGGAADKATLLGTALVALQGDGLSYVGALADAYAANTTLTQSFQDQATQVAKGQLAFSDSEKAAVDFTKGVNGALTATINYTKAGAGPLINQLSAIQTAAQKAAEATYQHNVATEGSTKAATDAAKVFQADTHTALEQDAKDLGYTSQQADALADSYFKIDNKDLKATVEAVGLSDINTTLDRIGQLLANFTHQPWLITTTNKGNAAPVIGSIGQQINELTNGPKTITLQLKTTGASIGSRISQYVNSADGNILDFYAGGGFSENHTAQISRATTRVWAEPETGGEAYIPLAPSKRGASTAIWQETGRRLGAFADGGFNGSSDTAGSSSLDALAAALMALAERPLVLQSNNVELARSVNSGNLVLQRVGS